LIIIFPNTQIINFGNPAGASSEGEAPTPPAQSFDVGGPIVGQTSRTAPGASAPYSRRDHERFMDLLASEEEARTAAARAAEKARVAHIYAAAREKRAQRIAAAEARVNAAKYGTNQQLSIIQAARRLAGLST
jgi:hypothetical protein